MNLDFYVKDPNSDAKIDDLSNSKLIIYKNPNTRRATSGIVSDVISIIKNTFSKQNITFGQNIDINQLATDITNIDGVDKIKTYRSDIDTSIEGLSLLIWNEAYPKLDVNAYTQNYKLDYFQYPTFNNLDTLVSRINVINPTGVIQITDF
jgi:hypothetical protein